jgi:hypothetical protein
MRYNGRIRCTLFRREHVRLAQARLLLQLAKIFSFHNTRKKAELWGSAGQLACDGKCQMLFRVLYEEHNASDDVACFCIIPTEYPNGVVRGDLAHGEIKDARLGPFGLHLYVWAYEK